MIMIYSLNNSSIDLILIVLTAIKISSLNFIITKNIYFINYEIILLLKYNLDNYAKFTEFNYFINFIPKICMKIQQLVLITDTLHK